MGVPLEGPTYVLGDNMSVINNTSKPESTLKKKSNAICSHAVREAVAMGECVTGHIHTHFNFADLLTKVLSGSTRWRFVEIGVTYFGYFVAYFRVLVGRIAPPPAGVRYLLLYFMRYVREWELINQLFLTYL